MKNRSMLMISAGLAALATATPAFAQEKTTRDYRSDDEIVVTAQKREETLVDVPQSVTVVSGDTLERQQATTFQDYAKLIPGLQLSQSNPGEARIVLRGINTGGVAATVATYVDETPFGSSSGQVNAAILAGEFDTFDVARIEVLRGPQGTLYGASSLGGVLKFVTNAPDTTKYEGRVRVSAETAKGGDPSYMGAAVVNVPLGDTFAVRASGFYRDIGGFIDSVGREGSDVEKNINDSKSYGGRVSALFTPSSDLSVRLTAIVQNLDTDASNVIESDAVSLETLYGGYQQSQFVPESTDIAYRVYNGTIEYGLGFADLTSSTSYSTLKESLTDDVTVYYGTALGLYTPGVGPAADLGLIQDTNVERFTQEVRLSSPASDTLEWIVGGYYTHEKGLIAQVLNVYDQGTQDIMVGFPQLADIFSSSKYEEYAGFANATVHFGPRFDVSLGGRYSHNDQSSAQGGTGLLAPPALTGESSEDVFTWSVAPKFKFSDTGAIYVRVAKGFRPGGPNIIPPGAPAGTPSEYASDSLISYEVGVKASTPDRTFSIDMAAFHIDWKDIQVFADVNGYGVNTNGSTAISDGFEFTAVMRPARGFAVSLNGVYTKARLTADTDPLYVGGRDGDVLPFTPKFNINANADYEWSIGGDATAYVGASLRSLSKQSANFSPAFVATYGRQRMLPSYEVADLRAGVDFGKFSIEAYVKNLTDAEAKTSVVGEDAYPAGAIGTGVIRPRTIGVTLGAGF